MVHQGGSDMASCTEEGKLFVLKSDVEYYTLEFYMLGHKLNSTQSS